MSTILILLFYSFTFLFNSTSAFPVPYQNDFVSLQNGANDNRAYQNGVNDNNIAYGRRGGVPPLPSGAVSNAGYVPIQTDNTYAAQQPAGWSPPFADQLQVPPAVDQYGATFPTPCPTSGALPFAGQLPVQHVPNDQQYGVPPSTSCSTSGSYATPFSNPFDQQQYGNQGSGPISGQLSGSYNPTNPIPFDQQQYGVPPSTSCSTSGSYATPFSPFDQQQYGNQGSGPISGQLSGSYNPTNPIPFDQQQSWNQGNGPLSGQLPGSYNSTHPNPFDQQQSWNQGGSQGYNTNSMPSSFGPFQPGFATQHPHRPRKCVRKRFPRKCIRRNSPFSSGSFSASNNLGYNGGQMGSNFAPLSGYNGGQMGSNFAPSSGYNGGNGHMPIPGQMGSNFAPSSGYNGGQMGSNFAPSSGYNGGQMGSNFAPSSGYNGGNGPMPIPGQMGSNFAPSSGYNGGSGPMPIPGQLGQLDVNVGEPEVTSTPVAESTSAPLY